MWTTEERRQTVPKGTRTRFGPSERLYRLDPSRSIVNRPARRVVAKD